MLTLAAHQISVLAKYFVQNKENPNKYLTTFFDSFDSENTGYQFICYRDTSDHLFIRTVSSDCIEFDKDSAKAMYQEIYKFNSKKNSELIDDMKQFLEGLS